MSHQSSEHTPLLQLLPPMPTVLGDDDDELGLIACENHPHKRRFRLWSRGIALLIAVMMLILVVVCSIRLYSNIETTVVDSLQLQINDVHLDGIDSEQKTINLSVDADASLDYLNNELDPITLKYLVWNSYMVDNLNLDLDNITITISTGEHRYVPVGKVKVAPFNVKVRQGAKNKLMLQISIKPDTLSILKALKDIIINRSIIELDGNLLLKIKVGPLRIPIKNMIFNFKDVQVDPSDLINELYSHTLALEELTVLKGEIDSSLWIKSSQDDHLLSKYIKNIPSIPDFIYLDLLMDGCNETFTLIESKVSGLSNFLENTVDNHLKLKSLNVLPSTFFDKCSDGTASPLSKLVQSIIYKEPGSSFYIKSSKRNEEIFPLWVNRDLLNRIEIPYHIPTLSNYMIEGSNSIIQNVSISNLELNIDNGIDHPQLKSGDINFDLYIPNWIHLPNLQISNLKGLVDLLYLDRKFGHMDITQWLQCQTDDKSTSCKLSQNDIIVTDGEVYGLLIAEYLMGGDVQIGVEFVIDAMIDWDMVSSTLFEINGLKGSGSDGL